MMVLRKAISRKWFFASLLVLLGTAFCIRLGFWQLDRLEQLRSFSAQVESMRAAEMLDLNQQVPTDVNKLEWRAVQFIGQYDFENQVAIRNQYYGNQYAYHLLTPLLSQGTAVLVDRGWNPADGNATPADWRQYDEQGTLTLTGQIRLGHGKPAIGGIADALPAAGTRLEVCNNLDVEKMSAQMPYPILAVFIQPDVETEDTTPPIPYQPVIELTEG